MTKKGTLDLPLHYGTVPRWLADRMMKLGRAISEMVILEEGTQGLLARLSDPFWFQSFGCALGMDWHSSGMTTSVLRALQRGLNPISHELGIRVLGGRGRFSRQTPAELLEVGQMWGVDAESLVRISRLTAKIDNTCIQDGYQIYLHNFVVTREGNWVVVQQGMDKENGWARRYHWHSDRVKSWFEDPHTAVVGENAGEILNLTDKRSGESRSALLDFLREHPKRQSEMLWEVARHPRLPSHHDVRPQNVVSARLGAVLATAYEKQYADFAEAILQPGIGPRTVQALGLVSELIYGKSNRFRDPARFTFAHGGKDGHPHPVRRDVYDQSMDFLNRVVARAKIENSEKTKVFKRLYGLNKMVEAYTKPDVDVEKLIERERKAYALSSNPKFSFSHPKKDFTPDLPF